MCFLSHITLPSQVKVAALGAMRNIAVALSTSENEKNSLPTNANLTHQNLTNANLTNTNPTNTNPTNTNPTNTNPTNTNPTNTNPTNENLTNTNPTNTNEFFNNLFVTQLITFHSLPLITKILFEINFTSFLSPSPSPSPSSSSSSASAITSLSASPSSSPSTESSANVSLLLVENALNVLLFLIENRDEVTHYVTDVTRGLFLSFLFCGTSVFSLSFLFLPFYAFFLTLSYPQHNTTQHDTQHRDFGSCV
jgi:hypothetical protein